MGDCNSNEILTDLGRLNQDKQIWDRFISREGQHNPTRSAFVGRTGSGKPTATFCVEVPHFLPFAEVTPYFTREAHIGLGCTTLSQPCNPPSKIYLSCIT